MPEEERGPALGARGITFAFGFLEVERAVVVVTRRAEASVTGPRQRLLVGLLCEDPLERNELLGLLEDR
ncbi:MAG: hypothetical protein ACRDJ0_02375 [Actinomycetota bacterium]